MNQVDKAKELFKQKYHCSQAVFAAFKTSPQNRWMFWRRNV